MRKLKKFSQADLREAPLSAANLSGADLYLANLREANLIGSDLSGAKLIGANLRGANLRGADLREAKLIDASLTGPDWHEASSMAMAVGGAGANLHGADLRKADLSRADLSFVDLSGANLSEADLIEANLREADLNGADVSKSILWGTTFSDVDLRSVKGLETVQHKGPSTIGIDTIYKSKGQIPEIFLRGAGVPEPFIVHMKALVAAMDPIQFYSCFISYSTKDQAFADRLYADLQVKGVRCWFAPHDIAAGRKIHEQIDEAIRLHERLLLILSPESMASEWVQTEIAKARKREMREQRRVLFPVRLVDFDSLRDWECFDADTGKDSAREIREYFIPDFSRWKDHDSYQQAFERLLRDLKAEAQKQ